MPDKLDKFVKALQKEIIQKEILDHSEKIVELFYNPQNWGKPPKEEITVFEERKDDVKGYFLGLYLKIKKDVIIRANFITDGCGVLVASASQLTIIITDKSVEFADNLKPEYLINKLNGVPINEIHYIDFAIKTLKNAIQKYKDINKPR
ncbi:MAG: iron-sulfur cluster assembly scaffold protein [Promethearchaeota archaeon]